MDGTLALGEKLIERDLCERLGIGRASLREALRTLEAEKLIINVPHRGPMVRTISLEEAKEIYAFRALLESYATSEFARQANDTDIEQLGQISLRLKQAGKRNNRDDFLNTKSEFYSTLLRGCNNSLVLDTLNGLLVRINFLRSTSLMQPGRLSQCVEEIDDILTCIKKRAPAEAEKKARHHVRNAEQAAVNFLKKTAHKPLDIQEDRIL